MPKLCARQRSRRKSITEEVERSGGRKEVKEDYAHRPNNQEGDDNWQCACAFANQVPNIDQRQRNRKSYIEDEGDSPQPMPADEQLAQCKAELHPEASVEVIKEEVQRSRMQLLCQIKQRVCHPLSKNKEHQRYQAAKQNLSFASLRPNTAHAQDTDR